MNKVNFQKVQMSVMNGMNKMKKAKQQKWQKIMKGTVRINSETVIGTIKYFV